MAVGIGVVCSKSGFRYTVLDDHGEAAALREEDVISVPASHDERGEQLNFLLVEARDLFERVRPRSVLLKKAGGSYGADPQRHEVEGVMLVAGHQAGVHCLLLLTEQVRARFGVKPGKGAYQTLLNRPDVQSRPSKEKRETYLYALLATTTDA